MAGQSQNPDSKKKLFSREGVGSQNSNLKEPRGCAGQLTISEGIQFGPVLAVPRILSLLSSCRILELLAGR